MSRRKPKVAGRCKPIEITYGNSNGYLIACVKVERQGGREGNRQKQSNDDGGATHVNGSEMIIVNRYVVERWVDGDWLYPLNRLSNSCEATSAIADRNAIPIKRVQAARTTSAPD